MEEHFTIERQDYAIKVSFKSGSEVSPKMIMGALDCENERYEVQGRHHIWDFRGCHPSDDFDYEGVLRIIGHVQNNLNNQWSIKTAILVDEDIVFGLSRMFQALVDNSPTDVSIFHDETAANKWIRQPAS